MSVKIGQAAGSHKTEDGLLGTAAFIWNTNTLAWERSTGGGGEISGTVEVSNFPATQPISGTVTANAGTGTFAVSAASLPLPSGAPTEATLAAMSAKLPASLGAKTIANSMAVNIASDQSLNVSAPVEFETAIITVAGGEQSVEIDCSTDGLGAVITHITSAGHTGVLFFEGTLDNSTWFSVPGSNLSTLDGQIPNFIDSETGVWGFNVSGLMKFRVRGQIFGNDVTVRLGGSRSTSILHAVQAYTFVKNSGDFDIQDITGTVSLPTGASTEAKQDTQITNLAAIKTAVETIDNAISGSEMQVDVVGALPTGTNSIGQVTANAGTNLNTSALALESGGNLAGAATSLAVMDDWDESDRAKVNPIVGQAGVQGGSGTVSANTQRVVLATDVALPPFTPTTSPSASSYIAVRLTNGSNFYEAPANMYHYAIASQVHVASANTVHWDLFNADATAVIRIMSIRQIPNVTTAVTGIVFDWQLMRTTSVGTGGSTQTAWLSDLSGTSLSASVTCRSKPTGGAAASTVLSNYSISSEETNAATIHLATMGGLELIPESLRMQSDGRGLVLRQNQGIRCVQVTNSNAGNTGWLISFVQE